MKEIFGQDSDTSDEHWISVSDLMAGLMVIFLFIAITYIRPIVETQNKIRDIVVAWKSSEKDIYDALKREFKNDLPKWNAVLDEKTLTIRFQAPDVLFDQALSTLKPKFKLIIADFFPRYIRILFRYKSVIEEVRIEGHTSSEWSGQEPVDVAYFKNMELSQARTRAVLEYAIQLPGLGRTKGWAIKYATANGLSSSRIILGPDDREDAVRSRRVEFRVRTNTKEQIIRVIQTVQ